MDDLTPQEAQILLVGIDVLLQYGWDGQPWQDVLFSAARKLDLAAGGDGFEGKSPAALRVVE